jgi:calcium-dependent protein kinase
MGSIFTCLCDSNADHKIKSKNLEEFSKKFTIESVIGTGQFSEVKKAQTGDKKVAVKCINLIDMQKNLHLLKREINIMKTLKHPNIVELYEIYENKQYMYITMEMCTEGNLKEKLNNEGPVQVPELKKIARKLLSALDYIHSNKVCHRDLKPENILFTSTEVKIADFGLARFMTGTHKFTMVGTPYYLSPEVISGDYNFKCDIWSIGVVFFFALTNRLPFYGEGYEDLFNRISASEIDWYGLNEPEQEFLRYLLRKDYKLRPTAREALNHQWFST